MAANNDLNAVSLLLRAAGDSGGDASELPRALLELGVRMASTAASLAVPNAPPTGLFARHRGVTVAGLGVLGVAAAWAGLWISGEPHAHRATGKAFLYAAVVLFAIADGLRRGFGVSRGA